MSYLISCKNFKCTPWRILYYACTIFTWKHRAFPSLQKVLSCPLPSEPPSTQEAATWVPLMWFSVSQTFAYFRISYKRDHPSCAFLCLHEILLITHVSNFFLLLSGLPLYEYTILFIHSSNDGQLDCFQFSAIMNKTPMNILVQGLFVAIGFHFSWVNTYKWNCWVTGQTYLTF